MSENDFTEKCEYNGDDFLDRTILKKSELQYIKDNSRHVLKVEDTKYQVYGQFRTKGFLKYPMYIGISLNDSTDDKYCFLYNLMTQYWKFPVPKLILSIKCDNKNSLPLSKDDTEAIKHSLMNAANVTPTWIFTNGFNCGISKLVGEASISPFLNIKGNQCCVIGIRAWDKVYNKKFFGDTLKKEPRYSITGLKDNEKLAPLDGNHDALILVDENPGKTDVYGDELSFREGFEKYVCVKMNKRNPENQINEVSVEDNINKRCPKIQIIVDFSEDKINKRGPENQINGASAEGKVPIIIIKTSKRAADATKQTDNIDYQSDGNKCEFVIFLKDLMKDLDKTLLRAVISDLNDDKPMDLYAKFYWSVTFNQIYEAKKCILGEKENSKIDLKKFWKIVLKENRWKFVDLFLAHGEDFRIQKCGGEFNLEYLYRDYDWPDIFADFHIENSGPTMYKVGLMIANLTKSIIVDKYPKKVSKKDSKNKEEDKIKYYKIQDLFLWAILTQKWEMAEMFLKKGRDQISSALVASLICVSLIERAEREGNEMEKITLQIKRKYFENFAKNVLKEAYQQDPSRAHVLLVRKLKVWNRRTCMEIAVKGKQYKFLDNITYQMRLHYIWNGRMPLFTTNIKIAINLPFAFLTSWCIIFGRFFKPRYYLLIANYDDVPIGTIFKTKDEDLFYMDTDKQIESNNEIKSCCDAIKKHEAVYLIKKNIESRRRIHRCINKLKKDDGCYYLVGTERYLCTVMSVGKYGNNVPYKLKREDKRIVDTDLDNIELIENDHHYLLTYNYKDVPIGTIFKTKEGFLCYMDTDNQIESNDEIKSCCDAIKKDEVVYLKKLKVEDRKGIHRCIKKLKKDDECYYPVGTEKCLYTVIRVRKYSDEWSYKLKRQGEIIDNANFKNIELKEGTKSETENNKEETNQQTAKDEHTCRPVTERKKCFYNKFIDSLNYVDNKISICKAAKFFFQAPKVKFALNIMSYIIFLTIFSYVCLVELQPLGGVLSISGRQMEYLIYGYIIAFILEELRKIQDSRYKTFKDRFGDWRSSRWSIYDIIVYILFILGVILRHFVATEDFVYARTVFSITLSMFYARFIMFYYISRSIGPKVISVFKMMKDIIFFLALFVIAVLSYGTFAQALLFNNSNLDGDLLRNIVYMPYWQLFRNTHVEYVEGNMTQYNTVPYTRNAIVFVAFAIYMLVTNLILINLLIAMFKKTFNSVFDNANEIYIYVRYKLSEEYYNRPVMPPPLNVFELLVSVFHRIRRRVKKKKTFNAFRLHLCEKKNDQCTRFEAQCVEIFENKYSFD